MNCFRNLALILVELTAPIWSSKLEDEHSMEEESDSLALYRRAF